MVTNKEGQINMVSDKTSLNLIAKKNFIINRNEESYVIVKGEILVNIPNIYHKNLITEGVI